MENSGYTNLESVSVESLESIGGMKLLLNVDMGGKKLSQWCQDNAEQVQRLVSENGALLLRGLKVNSSKQFGELLETLFGGPLLEYVYRSTPRTSLKGNVYTATEYSSAEVIPQHNENAYSQSWPNRIGFLCMLPSQTGGATPISDSRYIYQNLPIEIRQKMEEKGIMYVRNYSNVDLPWTEVFQTEDRAEVERYCAQNQLQCEWLDGDRLRTKQVNPAVAFHPQTGEKLWFNQAHLFHVSSLDDEVRKTMVETFGEEYLPRNCFYGDGSPIDERDLELIRELYRESTVRFDWQKHDVMLLDNMLFTHGRESFTGPRKILTGMAHPNSPVAQLDNEKVA
ncbi:TauD/TfdA family dioxygenase [Pseudoalteromonas sp. JBTF-M23]|uniref:TauD/TfdA family dioxygenase n=1 Tax=Pseudoalteromonas caenipelagi TaxID=2726988 RepID=A0A849VDW6_9GAMM|nr:TauD/TfdA family dioxygenase [Pseudoalteromonas caenipelagi]NOU51315.1 TauD/TfdA family dioxygenase [Pseudoalteromonas caenipelagi]